MIELRELLKGVDVIFSHGDISAQVSGLHYDSRKIQAGQLFFALDGFQQDGHTFIPEALEKGAVAVVSEREYDKAFGDLIWIQVNNGRKALGIISANLYHHPDLYAVGVTGTNGKTTVASLIQEIFNQESPTVKVGTLGMNLGDVVKSTTLTTPEAPDLFRFLAEAKDEGAKNVVMEVSSVALKLHRVEGLSFSQGIFTNFSGDHLDFHHTMEDYWQSKMTLFKNLGPQDWGIINIDDPPLARVFEEINCKYLTYGFSENADVRPLNYKLSLEGISSVISTPKGKIDIQSPLLGRLNLSNILAAVSSAVVKGISNHCVQEALSRFSPVKGRLDMVFKEDFYVLIDYAHTDEALSTLLISLKEIVPSRIILVFGAGGSRDKTKRPRMGQVASVNADLVVVTSDNPRNEDPNRIIDDIVSGFGSDFKNYIREVDREKAIERALSEASSGDLVVIAGKGHEDYQIFRDKTIHFDDYEVTRRILGENNA